MIEKQLAIDNTIYKVRTGSHLYGTNVKESDEDFNGIFIPTKDYVMGIKRCEQVILSTKTSQSVRNSKGDIDYTVYSLIKFIHLAIGNNPNIIELFFVEHPCVLYCDELGKELKGSYPLFISLKAYHTFKNYSYNQRKKAKNKTLIKLYKKLKKEIKKRCLQKNLNICEEEIMQDLNVDEIFNMDLTKIIDQNLIKLYKRINKKIWKYCSHLIRLLLECQQLLTEGRLTFPLPQNNLVRDIKIGRYSLEWVLNKASELEKLVDMAYANSKLQQSANIKEINKLQIRLLEKYWNK